MAVIAPWQKPTDVMAAMTRGSEVGLRMKQLRQQAADSLRRHSATLAGIAASRANSADRAAISREALASRERMAATDADLDRSKISEDARQADIAASLSREKLAAGGDSNFSYQNLGDGVVLKVNKKTGKEEKLEFPELKKGKQSALDKLNEKLGGADTAMADAAPQLGQEQPIGDVTLGGRRSLRPKNMGTAQKAPAGFVTSERAYVQGRQPNNLMTMGDTRVQGENEPEKIIRYVVKGGKLVKAQ